MRLVTLLLLTAHLAATYSQRLRCQTDDLKMNLGIFFGRTASITDNGGTLDVVCDIGYGSTGIKPRCVDGEWRETQPPCEEQKSSYVCIIRKMEHGKLMHKVGQSDCNVPDCRNSSDYIEARPHQTLPRSYHLTLICDPGYSVRGGEESQDRTYCYGVDIWRPRLVCVVSTCDDPGNVVNGKSKQIGKRDNMFYVGSSIEFSCDDLYYLKGVDKISCLSNASWSDHKPTCIKVPACQDLDVPMGGFVTYLTPTAQNAAVSRPGFVGSRTSLLPSGLSFALPKNMPATANTPEEQPDSDKVSFPPGFHRIGSRANYNCESRYYKLIGSRTRRCQGEGTWSGRPATCIPVCGRSNSPKSPFIVNGNATDIGQWPWQAGISRYLPDIAQWFVVCGASLLNERWVVTAAHCVTYPGTTITIEPEQFQVYLGKYHRQDSKDDEYVQVRKIQEIHIQPDYDPGLFDADIALLQLDSPIQLNTRVQPICLPTEQSTRNNLVEGRRGVVTGWGMNENETYSETLQQAVLPVIEHDKCVEGYEESDMPLTITDNMYCAGFNQGRSDACSGDSGGPMVFTDEKSKEKKWVLEGIVSWGSPQGCGNPKQYSGFTTVSNFLDWIHLYV